MRSVNIDVFGAFEAFRRYFKSPSAGQGDRKADDNEDNANPNDSVRNVEHWEDLRDSLRECPTSDDVSDGDLVNIPPLQFAKKILHSLSVQNLRCDSKR